MKNELLICQALVEEEGDSLGSEIRNYISHAYDDNSSSVDSWESKAGPAATTATPGVRSLQTYGESIYDAHSTSIPNNIKIKDGQQKMTNQCPTYDSDDARHDAVERIAQNCIHQVVSQCVIGSSYMLDDDLVDHPPRQQNKRVLALVPLDNI